MISYLQKNSKDIINNHFHAYSILLRPKVEFIQKIFSHQIYYKTMYKVRAPEKEVREIEHGNKCYFFHFSLLV